MNDFHCSRPSCLAIVLFKLSYKYFRGYILRPTILVVSLIVSSFRTENQGRDQKPLTSTYK